MLKKYLNLFFNGFLIGIANAIPGVSGGTIAFMVGIYEDILDSVKKFDLNLLKMIFNLKFKEFISYVPWKFLGCLCSGAIIAIISLSKVLVWLIQNKPVLINSFFFGLILATVPIVLKALKKIEISYVFIIMISTIGTYFFVQMVPVQTPDSLWFIFFCGAVAITAMILPGISGSFMLLILGKYFYVMDAVNKCNLIVLFVFMLGAFFGIIAFVRLLSWLLHKYHGITISVLTGFVIGSLNKIWPWKRHIESMVGLHGKIINIKEKNILPGSFNVEFFAALALIVIGFTCAILLERFSVPKKNNAQ